MPGDDLTHGPPATKKAGGSHHRFGQINRHSLRDGLRLMSRSCDRLSCPRRPRDHLATLGLSVGRPGPRDFAVRAGHVRLTCHPRPSHPPLTCRDDRAYVPLHGGGIGEKIRSDLPDAARTNPCDRLARRAICVWRACGNCALGKWVSERDWALKECGRHRRQRTHRQQDWASLLYRQRYARRQRPDAKHRS